MTLYLLVSLDTSPAVKSSDFKYGNVSNVNIISISGHNFRKIPRISKDDACAFCKEKLDPFLTPGYRCTSCKMQFHTKCIQNLVSKYLLTNNTCSYKQFSQYQINVLIWNLWKLFFWRNTCFQWLVSCGPSTSEGQMYISHTKVKVYSKM